MNRRIQNYLQNLLSVESALIKLPARDGGKVQIKSVKTGWSFRTDFFMEKPVFRRALTRWLRKEVCREKPEQKSVE